MKEYNFQKDLENTCFEPLFGKWLERAGWQNIQISEGYFPDYDIKATKNGVTETFEVKRDYVFKTSHNILIEYWYNTEKCRPGWFQYTKADYLVVFIDDKRFYIVPMEKVRFMWEFMPEIWERKEITQPEGFTTTNYVAKLNCFKGVKYYEI